MDREKTWINAITGIAPEKGAIPIYFDTDQEALKACFDTIGDIPVSRARVVHIQDTLSLKRISISRVYEPEIKEDTRLKLLSDWEDMSFDKNGNIKDPFDPRSDKI